MSGVAAKAKLEDIKTKKEGKVALAVIFLFTGLSALI